VAPNSMRLKSCAGSMAAASILPAKRGFPIGTIPTCHVWPSFSAFSDASAEGPTLRSGSSAHPGGQSTHPLLHPCLLLRGKSTPVSVSRQGEPEQPEPAEHTRQKHPDHGINRSRRNELGCCRRRWPRENRPSGRNNSGKKRTWPPLTTNTITAIARPIANIRINGPPLTAAIWASRPPREEASA
jgi:hypothetical protein